MWGAGCGVRSRTSTSVPGGGTKEVRFTLMPQSDNQSERNSAPIDSAESPSCFGGHTFGVENYDMQTLTIYNFVFNRNDYTLASMLLIKIVLCSTFPWTRFINHKCFEMKLGIGVWV